VLLAWYGIDYAVRTRSQVSAALGVSMMYVYLGMPTGCAMLAAHLLFIARGYVRGREFANDDGVSHDTAAAL
jgi:TRAP-type C4-dicarboxylate transport system permease small subunit